ncbi:hypothetical protein LTR53_016202 [Teratosphaeriaceae sp. CCFEE 6253]|nr:hypothetical protein LTR53_016202 [Teratosphaeriaceae sp. CCFEE 6253]
MAKRNIATLVRPSSSGYADYVGVDADSLWTGRSDGIGRRLRYGWPGDGRMATERPDEGEEQLVLLTTAFNQHGGEPGPGPLRRRREPQYFLRLEQVAIAVHHARDFYFYFDRPQIWHGGEQLVQWIQGRMNPVTELVVRHACARVPKSEVAKVDQDLDFAETTQGRWQAVPFKRRGEAGLVIDVYFGDATHAVLQFPPELAAHEAGAESAGLRDANEQRPLCLHVVNAFHLSVRFSAQGVLVDEVPQFARKAEEIKGLVGLA